MATKSQPNEETQELSKLIFKTKKTPPILNYYELDDKSVKSVLGTFSGYNPVHESAPFSVKDAKNVTANLINVSSDVLDNKYHDTPTNQQYGYENS